MFWIASLPGWICASQVTVAGMRISQSPKPACGWRRGGGVGSWNPFAVVGFGVVALGGGSLGRTGGCRGGACEGAADGGRAGKMVSSSSLSEYSDQSVPNGIRLVDLIDSALSIVAADSAHSWACFYGVRTPKLGVAGPAADDRGPAR
ncbi:hypothetical protein F5B20DRAFT_357651 [Whalleya microplaca]|nr:hypothetical protein F5B20DRAFT_357651 [Whalleya microplaca]